MEKSLELSSVRLGSGVSGSIPQLVSEFFRMSDREVFIVSAVRSPTGKFLLM